MLSPNVLLKVQLGALPENPYHMLCICLLLLALAEIMPCAVGETVGKITVTVVMIGDRQTVAVPICSSRFLPYYMTLSLLSVKVKQVYLGNWNNVGNFYLTW